jgi:hypothetical protein
MYAIIQLRKYFLQLFFNVRLSLKKTAKKNKPLPFIEMTDKVKKNEVERTVEY